MNDQPAQPSPDGNCPPKTEFIILSARAGNQAAWRELYERYRRMLIVTVECRMPGFLRRRFDAEDVLQVAFSKAWGGIEGFEYQGEGSFRRWLRQIVLREFRNEIKAQTAERRRVSREESGDDLGAQLSPEPAPSQILRDMESKQALVAKMAQLDDEQQELITMRIFEQKTWGEIGDVLGCSRDVARTRFDQTIKRLARGAS